MLHASSTQIASECFQCLRNLVVKAGQCEACGAPPLMVLEQGDVLPLQYFRWINESFERIFEYARLGVVLIDFPEKVIHDFADPISDYINMVNDITTGSQAQTGLGIHQASASTVAHERLRKIRETIFEPIRAAVERASERLAPLDAEYAMLEPHLILKDRVKADCDRVMKELSFGLVTMAARREHLQSHFDFGHAQLLKMAASDPSELGLLRAFQRCAYLRDAADVATVISYLKSGLGAGEFFEVLEANRLTTGTANHSGTVRPASDGFGFEMILHLLSWRGFRKDPRARPEKALRAGFALKNFRHTLGAIAGADARTDAYLGLALLENEEALPPGIRSAVDALAGSDSDFALSLFLINRPLDLETLKTIIVQKAERKILGWLAGWTDKEIELPFIAKPKLEPFEVQELATAAHNAYALLLKNGEPVLAEAAIRALRTHALRRQNYPAGLQNDLIGLLIYHETEHAQVCRAISMLASPADAFWLRRDIRLDAELFNALAGPDEWGYRMEMFFEACLSVKKEGLPQSLHVEPKFLQLAQEWFDKNKPGRREDLQGLWLYLERKASTHRDPAVLEFLFASWLARFALPAAFEADDALDNTAALSRTRMQIAPASRTFGASLEGNPCGAGLMKFIRVQANQRLTEMRALAMKRLIEQEELLQALGKEVGDQAYVNFLMEVLLMENLDDAGLFSVFFIAVQPFVENNPSAERLLRLRARATGAHFIENKRIQNMILEFVAKWPDPEQVLAEKRAADRAAETSHLAAKLSMVDEMIAKLQATYEENVRAEQKIMQDKLAAAATKLGAGMSSGEPAKLAEAQAVFTVEINAIQEEGKKKIEALANGMQQAKLMLKKIG